MAALAWLLIPAVAAVLAAVWARWAASARATGDGASLAGYERFRQAMQDEAPRPGTAEDRPAQAAQPAPSARSARPGTVRPEELADAVKGGEMRAAEAKAADVEAAVAEAGAVKGGAVRGRTVRAWTLRGKTIKGASVKSGTVKGAGVQESDTEPV